jgi:lipopolysaccharide transport system permease protein
MAPLIAAFQGVLVSGQWPQWASMLYPVVVAVLLCLLGMHLYLNHAGDMVDEL